MEDSTHPAGSKSQSFTPADRIAELNEIDKSIGSLLQSAGAAIQVLANSPAASPPSLSTQKAAFTEHTSNYFSTLSAIEVRLRRQVYALEEAGLIAPGNDRDAKRGRAAGSDEREVVAGGPLDVSWLNARAKDTVGLKMEKELWSRAHALVEELKHKKGVPREDKEANDETMGGDDTSVV